MQNQEMQTLASEERTAPDKLKAFGEKRKTTDNAQEGLELAK